VDGSPPTPTRRFFARKCRNGSLLRVHTVFWLKLALQPDGGSTRHPFPCGNFASSCSLCPNSYSNRRSLKVLFRVHTGLNSVHSAVRHVHKHLTRPRLYQRQSWVHRGETLSLISFVTK
jgi:hypothetical protein